MLTRLAALLCATFFCTLALAGPDTPDFADRYQDLARCMDRTMGRGWQDRYDIHLLTNRWGAEEPSEQDLDTAPQVIRMTALRCRREVNLTGQPRP
ncbi:MAG TPA: hypothetical protein VGI11_00260 [Variovorax sp.]|jgi:hypothetical protein